MSRQQPTDVGNVMRARLQRSGDVNTATVYNEPIGEEAGDKQGYNSGFACDQTLGDYSG